MPMDPKDFEYPGESEYCHGMGLFPPGVAESPGSDFGALHDSIVKQPNQTHRDNYARAVAERRTDTTDPESNADFTVAGNPDRYGANPPLIRETAPSTKSQAPEVNPPKLQRAE